MVWLPCVGVGKPPDHDRPLKHSAVDGMKKKARVIRAFLFVCQIGLEPALLGRTGKPGEILQVIGAKATRNGEGKVTPVLQD